MSKRLRQGDEVIVIAGNCKGMRGKILARQGERLLVEGVNVRKKCLKRSQENPKGGMIEVEMPIHQSNVHLVSAEGRPVRLRARVEADGSKVLYYRDRDQEVVYRTVNKGHAK